jgi:6-phosphogluconolactonase
VEESNVSQVRQFSDLDRLSQGAAEEILQLVRARSANGDFFSIALSGGHTPQKLYRLLADEYRDQLPWSKLHLFWGDERFVPHDDLRSNYRMVLKALIERVPIPTANVHPMPTHFADPEHAARIYEKLLREFFPSADRTFDLTLLGVGSDGHTASLFPNSPAIQEVRRWVISTNAPVEPLQRLSLSIPAINSSQRLLFLVSGAEKQQTISNILADRALNGGHFPASLVRGLESTQWFVDEAAGYLLQGK